MSRKLYLCPLIAACLLAGCGDDSPQAQLADSVRQLQRNLDARATSAVLAQLHEDFRAQGRYDRDWARRTMGQLFAEPRQVRFIALGKSSRVDRVYSNSGRTQAEVALAGSSLAGSRARPYSVRLEWWRENDTWKLARLDWQ